MSNPSPQTPEAKLEGNHEDTQLQSEPLEKQLESIDLNDLPLGTGSPEQRRKKLSARDLLERLSAKRLEVARIHFTASATQAGKGSHGEVVVGTLTLEDTSPSESGNQVAVKKFILSGDVDEERFLRTFANELHILDGLDHLNIIKLVGFVEDIKNRIAWLVFPWEANGNVREFLLSGKWELPERVSLIQDVATGLEYLHTQQPPIRHGDLKSLNILVNSEHRAVITDFGSARIQKEGRRIETTDGSPHGPAASTRSNTTSYNECPEVTVSATNAELTLTGPSWSFRWAAPEILNEEEPCLASDIWALGWISWEIVTDNYPFPEAKTNKSITIKVITGLLPLLYDDVQLSQIGDLCCLMVRCWKPEPRERPSATECLGAIRWVPSTIPRTGRDGISQIRSAALLVEMGEMHRLQSRNKEALKFFEDGVAIAEFVGDKETMAMALYLAADSHRVLANYDKAEECCNQLLDIYINLGNNLGRANALYRLGEIQVSRDDYTNAEESFNQALDIYVSAESDVGQANALFKLGEIHKVRSDYIQAEEYFNKALSIYTSIGNNLGRANVLIGLGDIHQAQSNNGEAEECFNQTLAISVSIGYSLGQANALEKLGGIHQDKSNHVNAEEYLNQALVIYTRIADGLGQANVLLRLGGIQQARSNYPDAEESFNQALAMYTRVADGVGQANVLQGLGEIYLARSNYPDAEESLNQALVIYTKTGSTIGRTNSSLGLGEVLIRQARYSEAKSFLLDAAEVSAKTDYEWAQTRSKELLAEVLEAENSLTEGLP